jgi:short-subunit dehydrogenase
VALPPPTPDSTAIVTGASSGIGVGLARQLARRGHGVTLVARREAQLKELADELSGDFGVRADVVAADLSDASARADLVAAVAERNLRVDILVNNAGIGSSGAFAELDRSTQLALVRVDVETVVDLCAAYIPGMVDRHCGAILNVASTAAFQPLPGMASYAGAKAFVLAFGESLAGELAGQGVTVTTLCPGPVKTEFAQTAGLGDINNQAPSLLWTSVEQVAKAGVDGMAAGRRVVIPGALNQMSAIAGRFSPRSVLLPIVRRFNPALR